MFEIDNSNIGKTEFACCKHICKKCQFFIRQKINIGLFTNTSIFFPVSTRDTLFHLA